MGIYFSPRTRNYHPDEFIGEFKGALQALLLSHREFQVLTPDTLASFRGPALMVPEKERLDANEADKLAAAQRRGVKLINLGTEASSFESLLVQRFAKAAEAGKPDTALESALQHMISELPEQTGNEVHASPFVVSQIARMNGSVHVYLFNVNGLAAKRKLLPDAENGAVIDFVAEKGSRISALPFLGKVSELTATRVGDKLRVHVPAFTRSIAIWCDRPGTSS